MIVFYRPFDEPVLCWTTAPVVVQPCPHRWKEVDGEQMLIQCVHLTIPAAQMAVICPKRSVALGPDVTPDTVTATPGLLTPADLNLRWDRRHWVECQAPKPWPDPPPA